LKDIPKVKVNNKIDYNTEEMQFARQKILQLLYKSVPHNHKKVKSIELSDELVDAYAKKLEEMNKNFEQMKKEGGEFKKQYEIEKISREEQSRRNDELQRQVREQRHSIGPLGILGNVIDALLFPGFGR